MMKAIFRMIYGLMVLVSFSACTKVDLCLGGEHPHPGQIVVSYDWAKATQPDGDMMVFASHALTGYFVNTKQSTEGGMLLSNWYKPEDEPIPLNFSGGKYNILACLSYDKGYKVSKQTPHISDLSLKVNTTTYPDFGTYILKNWIDNNKGVKNLKQIVPVYSGTTVAQVSADNSSSCTVTPKEITQHLTFELILNHLTPVVADSILVELSGVLTEVNLNTGLLNTNSFGRIYFPLYESVSAATSKQVFRGEVDVLGIVPGQVNLIFGAGIMNVGIFMKDVIDYRKFNLTTSLDKAQLLRYDDVLDGLVKNKNKADIHIEFDYNPNSSDSGVENETGNSIIWIEGEDGSHNIDEET